MTRTRTTTIGLVAALIAACLAGCAPSVAEPAATSTPTPTREASSSPTPTPTPTAAALTCENVLDPASIDAYASYGYTLSDDFAQRAIDQGWPTAAFVTNGGLLCQWGVFPSDASEYYGLSEATDELVATVTARLDAEGFTREPWADGELFVGPPTEGIAIHYLFAGDHWFVGFSASRIDEIRRNAGLA